MRKLIISEKNNAAFRIAQILSEGSSKRRNIAGVPVFEFERPDGMYRVIGLRGHIIALDYPKEYNNWSDTDISELVKVDPIKNIDPNAKRIVSALQKIASESDEIVIATDFDREGELIGVETLEELSWDRPIVRARFSALTRQEILEAFDNLVRVDFQLASAAETRRIIDLKWGAALTRFLSITTGQTGKDFLSAGRVQSPTLMLIVNREREIEDFVAEDYWKILAELSKKSEEDSFTAAHAKGNFTDEKEANEIILRVKGASAAIVKSYASETKDEYPPIPFNTTQFLYEVTRMGISAAPAMKIAESLYNEGYISYPRTDNTVYPPSLSLRYILKTLENTEFGDYAREIMSRERIRASRGKKSTTDHPPIYPTAAAKREQLKGNKWKIYEIVCRRFLATVSPPAKIEEKRADIDIAEEPFIASGRKLIEPGWRRIYIYRKFEGFHLPMLSVDEVLDLRRVKLTRERTKPPARFSQGILIQQMERDGLGTKSTRHETIQKLYDRKFVQGSRMQPTPMGKAIAEALGNHAQIVTDKKMTAHLEKHMDKITNGELTQEDVIEESQAMLEKIVEVLQIHRKEIAADINRALNKQKIIGRCPKCKEGEMILIHLRGDKRFIGCSRYPDCKTAFPVPAMGHIEPTDEVCKKCGSPKVITPERGKKAGSVCINPECEENRKNSTVGKCPSCGGRLRVIFSSRGKRFIGCEGYPDCKVTYPLPQKGGLITTEERCESCGAPIIKIISKGRRPWNLCANPECPSKKKNDKRAKANNNSS